MDHRHLSRLSRAICQSVAAAPPGADAIDRATPGTDSKRPLAGVPRQGNHRPPVACDVCGRTMLTGEGTREITSGGSVLAACPLCVISAQHDVERRVA